MWSEHMGGNKWIEGIGLMIAAPVIVMVGAVAVLFLSTPIMMALVVIVFAVAILLVGTAVTRKAPITDKTATEGPICESVDLTAALEPDAIEMVNELTDAPRSAVTASITNVLGGCPLGLMPGNTWEIGPDGKLSRPMCRPGATALSALFRMVNGDVMDRPACCECVTAGREVTFAVREPV